MRMNIVSAIENNSLLKETPAARQKVELREKDENKTFYISLLEPYMRRADEEPPRLVSLNKNNRY